MSDAMGERTVFDRAVEAGYRYTLERLDDLGRVQKRFQPTGASKH